MYKYVFALLAVMMATPGVAMAERCVQKNLPGATLAGTGEMHFIGWHVYDARLYAPGGAYKPGGPLALTLEYHLAIRGESIVAETLRRMRAKGAPADTVAVWGQQLRDIFPDIKKEEALTGIRLANGETVFCQAGRNLGRIKDTAFGNYFFGLWLDKDSPYPDVHKSLLRTR